MKLSTKKVRMKKYLVILMIIIIKNRNLLIL